MDAVTIGGALVAVVVFPSVAAPTEAAARTTRRTRGRELMQELVAQLAGVPASDVVIEARCPDCGGPHGRPIVMHPPAARDVRVTLAYAGSSIVSAAIAGRSLGVDAEPAGEAARAETFRGPFGDDALRHWTRIEAALKADGRGLRVDPHQVAVEQHGAHPIAAVPGDPRRYALHDVALVDALVVSLAVET
jgi:4'-phosphopantetheinyl transferase